MKKIFLVFAAFLFIFNASAQTGIIRGQVTDQSTGETLIGATMLVVGTDPMIATITDYDGNFSLEGVPAGTQSIQCTYIAYEKQIVSDIQVTEDKVSVINIAMAPESQDLGEVNITAEAIENTEASLLTIQRKSISVLNGISAQTFSKMGDSDAASAMKRVTGVSVEGGKYLFVRGLSDRYSKITLNGAEIPGLDPNKNTVQLDIFSTNVIKNIVVQKTFTPNLPASFAGGYVNIATKSFPTKFTLQFSSSFGFNPQANLKDDFLSFDAGKFSWFGVNDGTMNVPELANRQLPALNVNNQELDKITASFNNEMIPSAKTSFLNHSHSFSVGNQVKLFGKPFGFIVDMSYSRKFSAFENGDFSRYNLVGSTEAGIMNPKLLETESLGEEEVINSGLVSLSYKLTPFHKIGFSVLRSAGGLMSARMREGSRPEDNMYMYENTLGFQQRAFTSAQLSGNNVFGAENNIEIDWTSSYTASMLNEPDLRFFNYDKVDNQYQISYSAYPSPARFYRKLSELNFDNKVHGAVKLENVKIKFGGSFTLKKRDSESDKYNILSQGLEFNGDVSEYLSNSNIGQNAIDSETTYGVYYQNDEVTNKFNSYKADEYIAGTYLMAEFDLTSQIGVQAGVRYEYDYTFIKNLIENYHYKYVEAEKEYAADILPALNVNYDMGQKMNLRFAYSRTLGRPAFREIAPYAYYDFKEGWRVVGNPDLERSIIDNVDLRWEKYFPGGQLVSVSGFLKYFTKPIELIDDPRANNPELHYVNADNSFLYGIEIEIRKKFDFSDVSALMLGGNFTLLKSQVSYTEDYGSETGQLEVNRSMYGQSPWVINAFANYKNTDLGIEANMAYNVDGPKLAVVTKGDTPDVYQQPVHALNFNVSKKLGTRFSVKASVSNILDSKRLKTYEFSGQAYNFQAYNLGRTYSLSIKYLID